MHSGTDKMQSRTAYSSSSNTYAVTARHGYWNVGYDTSQKKICTHNSINTSRSSDTTCRRYEVSLSAANGTTDADIICEKNKWAKRCNVHWDGITNNSKACIKTTI